MTLLDPFGAPPEEPQTAPQHQPTPAPAPAPAANVWDAPAAPAAPAVVAVGSSDGKVVLTFKGGAGYSDPWIVVHANDIDEALRYVTEDAPKMISLMDRVQRAAQHFASQGVSAPAAPATQTASAPQPSAAPQGATQPPHWFPPAPAPGWVYKTGFKKDGSGTWNAWAPPQKGGGDWVFHNPPK